MAEPPNPARGALAVLSEKEAFGKLQPSSRESSGSMSAKKVRTEEKKAPRRVNGDGGSGGNGGQLQSPAAPPPQSYGSPAAWSFAARSSASSAATSRSCYSFSASQSVSTASASPSQPLPRKLLVSPSLLHAQPHRVLLPPVAPPAAAKPRRPKEKREKEKRRHGLGGGGGSSAARDENGEAKPLPRGGCRAGEGSGGGRGRRPARGGRAAAFRGARRKWSLEFRSPTGGRDGRNSMFSTSVSPSS